MQQQIKWYRETGQQIRRQSSGNHPSWTKKQTNKSIKKKLEEFNRLLRKHQVYYIHIVQVPGEERQKGMKNIFEDIKIKTFLI